jgi:glycosyltransferase involved in cell wall biosynthesis/aminoglycoside phosphotransferase (APT) family kinase protein
MIAPVSRRSRVRVVVVFDTAGFLHSLPLTGAAVRTLHLNRHLHALGCPTTVLLCDLNPRSRPTSSWPLPVRYVSPEVVYERTDPLFAWVRELAPDVLVMSTTQLVVRYGRALAEAGGARLVYEMHGDEGTLLRSIGAEHRQAALLQAAAVTAADGVVAFTDHDATCVRTLGARSVHVVPCGVEPGPRPPLQHPRPGGVVFVGNLYYEPNLRAVRYLHHTLAPRLAPDTVIDVFGRYPRDARCLADRVRLRGPVANLRAALAFARVGIAPLDCGGGMKLKVLEYLAAGLPVVGTPEAFSGFVVPERFALVSATATMSDLPELVEGLLADPCLRHRLGHAGRRLIEHRYSWHAMAQRARDAYAAVLDSPTHPGVAPPAQLVHLAGQPPYWLREWRGRDQDGRTTMTQNSDGQRWATSVVGPLAEAIDCARLAAESALGTVFTDRAIVGYGGRSMVFLAPETVLKVYTHRPSERLQQEITGLTLAAQVPGLRLPAVLGHDDIPGSLAWMSATRLAGTQASAPAWQDPDTTVLLGRVAARLHALPAEMLSDLPVFTRRIRDLPPGDAEAYRVGTALAQALTARGHEHRPRCGRGFVHGDFSTRNVLLAEGQPPGVIDFEGCGLGCCYEDLATLVMQDGLLGDRDIRGLLAGYTAQRAELGHADPEVDHRHLLFHLAWRARWILQWAVEIDPPLAAQVTALAPRLLAELTRQSDGDPRATRIEGLL